ncbi:MAG: ATP-binding protein [Polyangia bacterium]
MEEFFDDKKHGDAHDRFQKWRRENGKGFFLTLHTKTSGNAHTVGCKHPGNSDFTFKESGTSLTAKRKICAPGLPALKDWASANSVIVELCKHCIASPLLGSSTSPEKVFILGIQRESGWRYVVDHHGVSRLPAAIAGDGEVGPDLIKEHGREVAVAPFERLADYDYFIDVDGDIARMRRFDADPTKAKSSVPAESRRQVRIIDGDSVIVDGNRSNVGIVESRSGAMLRIRFPEDGYRSDVVERSRVESLSEIIADACRRGAKFSNSIGRNGQSTLGELAGAFGYRAESRLRRDTIDRVTKQLYRSGVRVDCDSISRDSTFKLTLIQAASFSAAEPATKTVTFAEAVIRLPDPFWPTALGLNPSDELRFFHALSQNAPIVALLELPERGVRAAWLQPVWEALLSWAYLSAQDFIWRSETRSTNDDAVELVPASALAGYIKPTALPEEKRLLDGPRHLNLVALEPSYDDRDLPRLKALWPGACFTFAPTWLNEHDPYATRDFLSIVQTLSLIGGHVGEWSPEALHNVSPIELVIWAKNSAKQLLARGTLAFGDYLPGLKGKKFRGSNESSTALALKSLTASWIRRHNPDTSITFEEQGEELVALDEDGQGTVTRVDVFAKDVGVFEIETLQGSGPIEDFYQRKVFSRISKLAHPFFLVVPSEALLWAGPYLADLAERMSQKKSARVLIPSTLGGGVDADGAVELVPLAGAPLSKYRVELPAPTGTSQETRPDPAAEDRPLSLTDIAGYDDICTLLRDEVLWGLRNPKIVQGTSRSAGILFYGPPGCGKTHIARALCGELKQEARFVAPSDLKGLYIGWGQAKIREQFQWLFDDDNRVLLIDEVDAIARSRDTAQMHTDEKADVNELLVQLDKASRIGRLVLCTTNYVSSLDDAVVRTGRFGHFVPVPPPSTTAATAIAMYYLALLGRSRDGKRVEGLEVSVPNEAEVSELFKQAVRRRSKDDGYFCNADIQQLVTQTFRRCARAAQARALDPETLCVQVTAGDLKDGLVMARRSIPANSVRTFLEDVREHSSHELHERFTASLSSLEWSSTD